MGSRTTVPSNTRVGLTSVFGMGTGDHHRYGRQTILDLGPVYMVYFSQLRHRSARCRPDLVQAPGFEPRLRGWKPLVIPG